MAEHDEEVTVSAPPREVHIDPDNPLPEPSFFWRRWLTWAVVSVVFVLVWRSIGKIDDQELLVDLCHWLMILSWFTITYYFIAPSAAELAQIIQSARIIKTGLAPDCDTRASNLPVQRDSGPSSRPPTGNAGESADEDVAPR